MEHVRSRSAFLGRGGFALVAIATLGVSSCGATGVQSRVESAQAPTSSIQPDIKAQSNLAPSADVGSPASKRAEALPLKNPQLIKTAHLTLQVEDLNTALEQVRDLLNRQQGDLLQLNSQMPRARGDRETYRLEVRIPQARFDSALDEFAALGDIQQRSIQAQDVSEQLIDAQARLKNLRKSEETVLKIMERSGSIPDVLNASKELSHIRETIERIDATFQSLQTQVAYATLNLNLQSKVEYRSPTTSTGNQLQNAWNTSTQAMGNMTIALLKLGIWGIAFGPYMIALGGLIWFGQKQITKSRLKGKILDADPSTPS